MTALYFEVGFLMSRRKITSQLVGNLLKQEVSGDEHIHNIVRHNVRGLVITKQTI